MHTNRSVGDEMAREDLLSADILLESGTITYEEYINEVKAIDKEYGTNFYAEEQ